MRTFSRHDDVWTDGVWTIQITETSTSAWATLSGPTRGTRQSAAVDAQNLADAIEAGRDDTTTAHEEDSAELDKVVAILDELDAPRVLDTRTLTPAERLGLYLDQRAEQRREAAVDDAAEWASDVYTQRGLVLAIAELGHALARGAR